MSALSTEARLWTERVTDRLPPPGTGGAARVVSCSSPWSGSACDSCGSLEPFTDEGLERAVVHASQRVSLYISEHEIVLHRTCRGCAA